MNLLFFFFLKSEVLYVDSHDTVRQVMEQTGADSRASRLCCVICGASETVFFTGSLSLGAAGVKKSRYAVLAALTAYAAGVLAAAMMV